MVINKYFLKKFEKIMLCIGRKTGLGPSIRQANLIINLVTMEAFDSGSRLWISSIVFLYKENTIKAV